MYEVHTSPCLGCGTSATFTMTEEQFNRFKAGEHVQNIFPDWSADDREMLISGTCPICWVEMLPPEEEEEDWYPEDDSWVDEEALYTAYDLLEPESDLFNYERDWYVD